MPRIRNTLANPNGTYLAPPAGDIGGTATAPTVKNAPALGIFSVDAYGAAGDGATDDSAAFVAAIAAAVAAGGGNVTTSAKTYSAFAVNIPGGVFLRPAPGAVFKAAGTAAGTVLSLGTANFSDTVNYAERCGIVGGPFTVDFSGLGTPGGYTGQRGISVYNARHWTVENAVGNQLDSGSLIHMQRNGGNVLGPVDGVLRNCRSINATNDSYGVVQVTCATRMRVDSLYADHGVALRIENDGSKHGNCEDIYATQINCVGGRAAVYITAHNDLLQRITIDGWYAKTCSVAGVSFSNDAGASIGDIEIANGIADGTPVGVGPSAGVTLSLFGKIKVRSVRTINPTVGATSSVGNYVMGGATYEDCTVEDGAGGGWSDAAGTGAQTAHMIRCKSIRNTGVGFKHEIMQRVYHEHCSAYDDSPYGTGVGTEILTTNQQGAEAVLGTGDFTNSGSSTVARTTAAGTYHSGSAAYQMTTGGSGAQYIGSVVPQATGYIPVVAGTLYVVSVWIKSALESRNAQIQLTWYNGASTNGSSLGSATAIDAGDWTQLVFTATAPANSNGVRLLVPITNAGAASEVYYYDDWSFRPAAKAQTQTYGLQATLATQIVSIASRYGPNLSGRINGSALTHQYVAPVDPVPGSGMRSRTSASATTGAATLPANPRGFLSVQIGGVEKKVPYYDV